MSLEKSIYIGPLAILAVILVLFMAFLTAAVLNVMVARQVLGFIYLTFIPGFLILRILRIRRLDWTEATSLSVGLGIVFLMIIGLFLNGFGTLTGFLEPLSMTVLMIASNIAILSLCLIDFRRARGYSGLLAIKRLKLEPSAVVICCLPLLSVAGSFWVNVSPDNNFLLLSMLLIISLLVVFTASEKLVPRRLYPLLLLTIAIALLLHSSLISSHINGFDVQHEYRFMETTVASSRWVPNIYDKFQSLLSVSVLPAIYCNMLNLDSVWIIKIIFPLVFALVPLVIYTFFKRWVSERVAFLATFFFMANSVFFTEMLTLGRQMIAELFFVLLLYVLLNNKINGLSKIVLFALFSFGLIASHYAIASIFMLIILSAWTIISILNRNYDVKNAPLQVTHVMLYSAMLLCWYIYVSASATFNELLYVFGNVYSGLFTEFFNVGSRGETVLSGIGLGSAPPTIVQLVGRVFFYATEILIVVGFVTLIIKRKKIFDREYRVILSIGMAFLAMAVLLPNFAGNLGMARLYHVVLLMLAPLCILGCETIFDLILKTKNQTLTLGLTLIVLVPFFLFQTGFIYEVTGVESWSIPLSRYRFNFQQYIGQALIDERDIFGIQWLYRYDSTGSSTIYSDSIVDSIVVRGGYGMFPTSRTEAIVSNTTEIEVNGIVYLTWANTAYGTMGIKGNAHDYLQSTIFDLSKVYSNGACEIYREP